MYVINKLLQLYFCFVTKISVITKFNCEFRSDTKRLSDMQDAALYLTGTINPCTFFGVSSNLAGLIALISMN